MTMWKDNLQNIHANDAKEFLLGGTSTMDQVFLSHQCPRIESTDFTIDVCNNKLDKVSSPAISEPRETFDFGTDNKKTNCYQVTLSSFVLIAIICFLLLLCRDYIKDLLVWMENVDLTVSFLIFLVLYTIVSYPMAWGVILLMIACGYLYGLIYGPIVVEVCSAVGVAIAHVTMKRFCRSFIIKKFYNDNMTAVISVVGGKHGFKVVALTRLTPLPFGLQNSLFSLTDIPLLSYVSASTLGMLPTAVLNCYMGTTLRSMNDILTDETNQATGWIVLTVQILFTIALMFFVVRKARVELKKTVEDTDDPMSRPHSPEVVVHNDAHKYDTEIIKTNGFIHTDRSRNKSGN
ncbi:transmembrane protein 64-like [Ruditapes philippinarum]|uniref:transmembrane protein 64-like n=1 Tax=Ruditapes philippinarum TaxID=129788 RepID=UPI00295A9FA4|nr:transmembrane protein 64-like [Ruditapes philippinarum]